jgi:hypothetical protein
MINVFKQVNNYENLRIHTLFKVANDVKNGFVLVLVGSSLGFRSGCKVYGIEMK